MSTPSSTSTIAAARGALYELLAEDPPAATSQVPTQLPKPIQVSYGDPSHIELEVVALLGVRSPDEDDDALGARRRVEKYDLEVGIKVENPAAGDDAAARAVVDARGFFIAEWVRSVVHRHWTLNDTVRTAFVRQQITDGVVPKDKAGCVIFILMVIHCTADIFDPDTAP